jgi:hypothetical protein
MGFSREWWVRLPSVAGAWRLPFDDDPTDGRPKLIGRHRKKDDKWTRNNVAVCHMSGSRMKHLPHTKMVCSGAWKPTIRDIE